MFKKANIIVVTLFITLIVWLIGLLVTKYIYQLVRVSSENHKYYKAYYIAYAGIETELLKMKNHGLWFEDEILSGSESVTKNFTGLNCYFSSHIFSLSKNVTNNPLRLIFSNIACSKQENWISLKTWDAILLPWFYDKNNWEWKLSGTNYKWLNVGFSDITLHYKWDFVVSLQVKNPENSIKKQVSSATTDSNGLDTILWVTSFNGSVTDEPYLVIWALENWSFCISSNSKIVNIYSYVQSWGSYQNRKVLLNVAKKHKWANFTVYWIY